MPSVTVAPGNDPTHDLSLNDGAEIFGLILDGGERSMQETPMTSPARQFTVNQTSYTSGRGRARLSKDQAGFYDSLSAFTLTDEVIHNAPRTYSVTLPDTLFINNLPNSMGFTWYTDTAVAFTPASTFTATFLEIMGNLRSSTTATICADNSGVPGTVLKTCTFADSFGTVKRQTLSFAAQTFSASTKYWIRLQVPQKSFIGSYNSVNPSYPTKYYDGTWKDATYTIGFTIGGQRGESEFLRFDYLGAMFLVTKPKAASGSQIYLNGALGKATSATGTTIVDTGQAWAIDAFAGAYVRITAGKGLGQARQIVSNTATALTVATWDETPDTTSYFAVYATPVWKEITGHGLTKVVSKPVVSWGVVYFPQGPSVNVRRMQFTGSYAYADDAANRADQMFFYRDGVWKLLNEASTTDRFTQLMYAPPQQWGTDLVFTGNIRCGTSEYPATNMMEFDGALYVAKNDSLWRIYDNVAARLNLGIEIVPDDTNGKAMASLGGGLYFSWSHSVERLQGSVLDDIGWWKNEGLPTGRRGYCSSMAGALAWMYAALDAGASGESAVMVHNGRGWHEIYRAPLGQRIREVFWQQCPETNPHIWFSHGNNLRYMKFPNQTLNILNDSSTVFEPSANVITSTIDAGEPTFYKILKGVQIVSKNLGSTAYIDVDYQVNNDVGTDEWIYAGRANVSPVDFVSIGADGKGSITQMRLRFRLVSESATVSPVMYSWQAQGHVVEPIKYQWNLRIKVAGNQNTKKSTPDHKPDDLLRFLDKAAREMRALRMRTKYVSSDDKIVYVSPPTIVRTAINTILKQWTGSIIITLREV